MHDDSSRHGPRRSEMLAEAAEMLDRVKPCAMPDCDETSNPWATDLPICMQHFHRVNRDYVRWVETYVAIPENRCVVADDGELLDDTRVSPAQLAEMIQQRTAERVKRQIEAERAAWDQRRIERDKRALVAAAARNSPAVYYIRMSDNRIKIGFTTDLRARAASYCSRPEDILAVEPGGRDREAQRHREFSASRLSPRGELFQESPALLAHIALVRKTFGDPRRFVQS